MTSAVPPKGFTSGFLATSILAGLIPFLVLESLAPVLRGGVATMMASILPDIGVTGLVVVPLTVGLPRRGPWYVSLLCGVAGLVLVAFTAGLLLGFAVLAGFPPPLEPRLRFMTYMNIGSWVLVSPLAWLIWRLLRNGDWRPWAAGQAG